MVQTLLPLQGVPFNPLSPKVSLRLPRTKHRLDFQPAIRFGRRGATEGSEDLIGGFILYICEPPFTTPLLSQQHKSSVLPMH